MYLKSFVITIIVCIFLCMYVYILNDYPSIIGPITVFAIVWTFVHYAIKYKKENK